MTAAAGTLVGQLATIESSLATPIPAMIPRLLDAQTPVWGLLRRYWSILGSPGATWCANQKAYSERSATRGSVEMARRAGPRQASSPAMTNSAATTP